MTPSAAGQPSYLKAIKRLKWAHLIFAVVLASASSVPLRFGAALVLAGPMEDSQGHGPPFPGIPMVFGFAVACAAMLGLGAALLTFISGVFIGRFRFKNFSILMAAVCLVFIPIGTVLGVWTLQVLTSEEISRLYRAAAHPHQVGGQAAPHSQS
jgi:hypothetical protein